MKTQRNDVVRDKRKTFCRNSSFLGYSSYTLKYGDFFIYKEQYEDGRYGLRTAKYHGRIRPKSEGKWLILAQSISTMLNHTYERWIDPDDVIETCRKEYMNQHIKDMFEEQERINLS